MHTFCSHWRSLAYICPTHIHTMHVLLYSTTGAVSKLKWSFSDYITPKDWLNQLLRTSQLPVWYSEQRPLVINYWKSITLTLKLLPEFIWIFHRVIHVFYNLILGHCSKCKVHYSLLSQFTNPSSPKALLVSPLSNRSSHHCPPSIFSLLPWKPPVSVSYTICKTLYKM